MSRPSFSQVIEDAWFDIVVAQAGDPGTAALRQLLADIRGLYEALDLETANATIECDVPLDTDCRCPAEGVEAVPSFYALRGVARQGIRMVRCCNHGLVQLSGPLPEDARSVRYFRRGADELLVLMGKRFEIPAPPRPAVSWFAKPEFTGVREAIQTYGQDMVRHSSCLIFQGVWNDDNRLFLRARPEEQMRKSLAQFLRSNLRDLRDVQEEGSMDGSRPVDIKISFFASNRTAIVEVKWLGASADQFGNVTTTYTPVRAKAGAKQLAQYLDLNLTSSPRTLTRGYLVVIDARRRGLRPGVVSLSQADGWHYELKEIAYTPAFHLIRDDFDPPLRLFARPLVGNEADV